MGPVPLLVIVGPTASGKTALAVECAAEFDGEVISADSMQIYKGMNIATAKPTAAEMRGIKHHLIDFLDVDKSYSVADFVRDANNACDGIISRSKLPILCGGTGLYVDSFVNNVSFEEMPSDEELRARLTQKMEVIGAAAMIDELAVFDPKTASKLHENNKKRIIRAFEAYLLTGKTMSQLQRESMLVPSRFDAIYVGISYSDRDTLYRRINERVDAMIRDGLEEEARRYYNLPSKATSSQAIGYKELKPYFDGEITLEAAAENLKLATRRYAKRQLTWFRRNPYTQWFYPDNYGSVDDFYTEVKHFVRRRLDERSGK